MTAPDRRFSIAVLPVLVPILLLTSCRQREPRPPTPSSLTIAQTPPAQSTSLSEAHVLPSATPLPTVEQPALSPPMATPTPDPTRPTQSGSGVESHVVQYGQSLGTIAAWYSTTVEALMTLNGLTDPNAVQSGQTLLVPAGQLPIGPPDKLIPDSELVYGPAFSHFDVTTFARRWGGYLLRYSEEVEGGVLSGPEIVQLVAQRFSVGPRLLLALLELESGWVTELSPAEDRLLYPMGRVEADWDGLFIQLSWAANQLNRGYYDREAYWPQMVELEDGTRVQLAAGLNAGTAAVQTYLALHNAFPAWQAQVAWDGSLMSVYRAFFGNPFRYAIEPLIPPDLVQPEMALPWKSGEMWYYTGGPHGGWGSYGWAALDFVPAGEPLGCERASEWARAICPGRVVRSENGEVVVDLEDDGFEGIGWSILYLHVAPQGRVPVGTWLETGDKVGHPSCDGGFTDATHLHVARRYNGRWMEAAGPIPFVMDGWTPVSYHSPYDGALVKGEEIREACECREPEYNGIVAGGLADVIPHRSR